ncbi:protein REVERSION-TO-ETHYLENE SENSITIVITY1-like isoform X1 [Nicotiana tabacum]|uniref:Protein REVERSION-TO-ETHYLENE SENSITIVITY1-like isoform X1 n=1 Tax=Nicotiana tabacum TaxID=4097 RepID=A0A1S4BQB9_TOBAC|nr:PREDICTED: protein REVERSION-TO-ETHYLENE SENSITIVITY1-like isoform X1 [Nicotiana tabacum]XP_016491090.1 PREDICTED: protein REVERSION-TO-ETHYLENE SENSITIVITY1-like isoform X1 [Nicotiana tabacum]
MFPGRFPMMDVNPRYVVDRDNALQRIQHDLWPLDEIDPKKEKFPCCLVWTPLPVVSWLAPFVGHVGICREDGTVVDFSGSNMITVGNLSYGAVARYYQLDRRQCCFPPNLAGHTCKQGYQHAEFGTAVSWDDALHSSTLSFEHRNFNPFTCNDHSFVADCLNRLSYGGSMNWNMVNVGVLVLSKGQWVNGSSILRSFMPFIVMVCFGHLMVGWQFLIGILSFFLLVAGWYILATYCFNNLIEY